MACQQLLIFFIFLLPKLSVSLSTVSISYAAGNTTTTSICAITQLGSFLNCTSFPQTSSIISQTPITFPDISVSAITGGNGFQCVLRSFNGVNSTLTCLRFPANPMVDYYSTPTYKRIYRGPLLADLEAGDSHICGVVAETRRVRCWQWPEFDTNTIAQNMSGIAVGGDFICWLSDQGTVECYGNDANKPNGNFNYVSAGSRHACGISSTDGKIVCWGESVGTIPDDQFKSLALGDRTSCGLRINNTVVCWGNGFQLPLDLEAIQFFSIEAKGNVFCGVVRSNFSLICFGGETINSTLVFETVLPGPCQRNCSCTLPGSARFCNSGESICDISCDNGSPPPPPALPPSPTIGGGGNDNNSNNKARVAFLVVGSVGTSAFVMVLFFFLSRCCRKKWCYGSSSSRIHDSGRLDEEVAAGAPPNGSTAPPAPHPSPISLEKKLSQLVSFGQGCQLEEFSLPALHQATDNFSLDHKIGSGSFGTVYRATLDDGREVAIKRAEISRSTCGTIGTKRQDDKESAFSSELAHLSRVNHKNLVRLYGFCEDINELVLVYEFMSNGTLSDHLHKLRTTPLRSWTTRLKVALDAARGIEYLHRYVVPSIIHRDIKSSNILLDSIWTAKVSDFGLSLMGPEDEESHLSLRAAGTVGYMDPEYFRLQKLTTKSDVYSFGVVLLELLSGLKAIHLQENGSPRNVVDFMLPHIDADELHLVLDPKLAPPAPYEIEAVNYVGYLAADCVNLEGRDRPPMTQVVTALERALEACAIPISSLQRSQTN
ncbi:hypothetical protein ACHQM5_017541 [Ranunculus cassubicifolius]